MMNAARLRMMCLLLTIWCAVPLAVAQSGNTSAQEYGDPVYREFDPVPWADLRFDDHAALFAGINSSGTPRIIHVQNTSYVVHNGNLSNMRDSPGLQYWGAYNVNHMTLSFETRKDIVSTAVDLVGRDIRYPFLAHDCLNRDAGGSGRIDPSEIAELRCDGLVEYCYEYNGVDVWGKNGQRYDISYGECGDGDPYCGEHNNLYDHIWPYNADVELSPRVQRGALGGTSTHMTYAASVSPPVYDVEQTQGAGVTYVTTGLLQSSILWPFYRRFDDGY